MECYLRLQQTKIASTEAICKNFCNPTWTQVIKKNQLQDYLLCSHEKVPVILLQSFLNESVNHGEFEFIILFLSHKRHWKRVHYCRYNQAIFQAGFYEV